MEHLTLCSSDFYKAYSDDPRLVGFPLDLVPLHFALLTTRQPDFDPLREPNSVLVQKKAFSCNYRDKGVLIEIDHRWHNRPGLFTKGFGSEFVAEVVAVGAAVTQLQPGHLVVADVSYPEAPTPDTRPGIATNHGSQAYEVFHQAKLMHVPDRLSVAEAAAAVIGATTAHSMIRRLNLHPSDRILVTSGRSNTSLFVLAMLQAAGLTAYTICSQPGFDDRFRALGVEDVFHFRLPLGSEADRAGWNDVCALKPTVIIDPFLDLHFAAAVEWLDYGGRYITCGLFNQYFDRIGQTERASQYALDGLATLRTAMRKNITFIGNCLGTQEDLQAAFAAAGQWQIPIDSVWQGTEGIRPFLDRSFVSEDRFGKVVFRYATQ
jgi:NADPH:quinone reductase-like Zn-dependent oxidoreductase